MKIMIGDSTYQLATATQLCGSIEKPEEPVTENYGTITYYSDYSIEFTETRTSKNCTLNNIDQQVFSEWASENPLERSYYFFSYSSGVWEEAYLKVTVEDLAEIGLDVTLTEGATSARFYIAQTVNVNTSGPVANYTIVSEAEYENLANGGSKTTFDVDGGIPVATAKSFIFGSLATTTPSYFLCKCSNLESIDMSSATSLTSIGMMFLYVDSKLDCEIEIPETVTSIGSNFLASCSTFNHLVTLPSGLTGSLTGFMGNCDAFNQPVTIPAGVAFFGGLGGNDSFNSTVTFLGDDTNIAADFLSGNVTYNQPLTLPANMTSIGTNFLKGSTAFNQPVTIPNSVTTIGAYFMNGCTSFNQPLTLSTSLTNLHPEFMVGCTSFNQPLTLPASITQMNGGTSFSNFMYRCDSFLGPLTINTGKVPGSVGYRTMQLATNNSEATAYTTGITLAGPYAQTWKNALVDESSNPYRKLIVAS